jgi:outer membrane protein assembly factor BamB
MNWKRAAFTLILTVCAGLWLTGCPKVPPVKPGAPVGPDSTWIGGQTSYKVSTTSKSGNVRYEMDWGDAANADTSDDSYKSAETAYVRHTWDATGDVSVRVRAMLDAVTDKISDWSDVKTVKVLPNSPPVIDLFQVPPVAVRGAEAFFLVVAHDDDGDSVVVNVKWGDNSDTTSSFVVSPCSVILSHVYTQVETVTAIATVSDWKGRPSTPESAEVKIGKSGGVKWFWRSTGSENPDEPLTTSPVVISDGDEEVLCAGCEGDYKFYAISTARGKAVHSQGTKVAEEYFPGHPGFCASTGHVIVGSSEGELYALKSTNLGKDWQWPDAHPDSMKYQEWGPPAISGNRIYICRDNDSLFLFEDLGSTVSLVTSYFVAQHLAEAPVIDVQGNVYVGTTSGALLSFDNNLNSPRWTAQLQAAGEVFSPIIGADGTIYCVTDSFRLFSLNPATGAVNWTKQLDGEAMRPAIGQGVLYIGTSFATFYALNPSTGDPIWQKTLGNGTVGISTTPIVTDSGLVFVQNEDDVLYCLNQADGSTVWYCECRNYLPRSGGTRHPRRLQMADFNPNPTIDADGDIYVVGADALFCVAGYAESTLDPASAWPKWQKDLYNTGKK